MPITNLCTVPYKGTIIAPSEELASWLSETVGPMTKQIEVDDPKWMIARITIKDYPADGSWDWDEYETVRLSAERTQQIKDLLLSEITTEYRTAHIPITPESARRFPGIQTEKKLRRWFPKSWEKLMICGDDNRPLFFVFDPLDCGGAYW